MREEEISEAMREEVIERPVEITFPTMLIKRKTTGIPGLDAMIQGGIPAGCCILITGDPGTGKTTFCKQFVLEGLVKGEPCIWISTNKSFEELINDFKITGVDITPFLERFFFIDCYSFRSGSMKKRERVFFVKSIADLNVLLSVFKQVLAQAGINGKGGRIIIDSFSDFISFSDEKQALSFLERVSGVIKGSNSVALIVLESGLHKKRVVTSVDYFTDGRISLAVREYKRFLRVPRLARTAHPLNWIEFKIEKGIVLKFAEAFGVK